jgi:hypothetical protein
MKDVVKEEGMREIVALRSFLAHGGARSDESELRRLEGLLTSAYNFKSVKDVRQMVTTCSSTACWKAKSKERSN